MNITNYHKNNDLYIIRYKEYNKNINQDLWLISYYMYPHNSR